MEDIAIDNPQLRLCRLCWLAGVIDSDGSITVMTPKDPRNGQVRIFRPRVNIVNTNRLLIERAADILTEFAIGRHVSTRRSEQEHWRMRGQINVDGFKRAIALLKLIEPHLVAKREQAQLIMQLWESRSAVSTRGQSYRAHEIACVNRVRFLNQTGVTFSSEANTPDIAHWKPNRPTFGKMMIESDLR